MTSDRKPTARAILIVLGLCLFFMAGPAAAQLSLEQQRIVRRSCRFDFMQNCFGILPRGPAALQCLQRNAANLSAACQVALNAVAPQPAAMPPPPVQPAAPLKVAPAAGPHWPTAEQKDAIRQSCRSDFISHCAGVQPGGAEALHCLQRNASQLSPKCGSAVAAVGASPGKPPASAGAKPPAVAPNVIYVTNFQLDPEAFHPGAESPLRQMRPGLLGNLLKREAGSKNPAEQVRGLIDLMARQLVKDLEHAGLKARRLAPGESLPLQGWLVRGVFTKLDEGKKLERAVIGLGAGKTALKVVVTVDDLEHGNVKPLYTIDESAHSGILPGGAVTAAIRFNPYVLAAHFVMSGRAIERNIKKTAREISAAIVKHIRK
jgi:Domain of unknown function (DUF4410)/Cysteine rich repeat